MKEIITLLIIVTVQQVLVVNTSTYYITPGPYSDENETEEVFLQWSTIQHNISRYFTSHTEIYFLPGEYNFDQLLTIENCNNVSMIGKSTVTFKCTYDAAIFINGSIAMRIHNVKFVNCGANEAHFVNDIPLTTIGLFNVESIVLSNITFENSLGHGIVGINVLGSSILVNITVYHNNNLSGNSLRSMGGIILVYVDTIDGVYQQSENNVLMQNCTICCMSEQSSRIKQKIHKATQSQPYSSLVGLIFYQQKFTINVELINISIMNVVLNTPIVYFAFNSSMSNSVSIYSSIFTKIINRNLPIMSVIVGKLRNNIPHKSTAYLEINNCIISFNSAKLVNIRSSDRQLKVRIKIISTEFSYNKRGNCNWKSINNTVNASIVKCTFKSNIGFNIQISNIHTAILIDNLFYNNSVQNQTKRLLVIIDNSIPIFEGNNEFSFNNANVIISFKVSYVLLKEGSTLNISCNSAKLNATEQKSLIVFSEYLNEYLCRFQFLSNKTSLDQDFTNNTINFSLVFNNNHNYTNILYGTLLHSCQWIPNGAFHTATPGDVYKRLIQYNTTNNIIGRREPTYCYCDNITVVDCFKDNFTTTPLYPGQKIPIKLTQVPTPEVTGSSVYLWRDISEYIKFHNAINKPCKLVPYQPPNWRQFIHRAMCIPLFYRALTNTSEPCFVSFSSCGITKVTYYRYYISFNQTCPPGFELQNSSCECNKHLKAAFPTLTCNRHKYAPS